MEWLIKREAKLKNLENSQPSHIAKYEQAYWGENAKGVVTRASGEETSVGVKPWASSAIPAGELVRAGGEGARQEGRRAGGRGQRAILPDKGRTPKTLQRSSVLPPLCQRGATGWVSSGRITPAQSCGVSATQSMGTDLTPAQRTSGGHGSLHLDFKGWSHLEMQCVTQAEGRG